MSVRRRVYALLAVGHLVIVICGACYCLPYADGGPLANTVRWYARMSGAYSSYGFFAPDVGSIHRARFVLQDEAGSTWEDVFDEAETNEARLRLTGIVDATFMNGATATSPEWRHHLVRSWAAAIFARNPSAVSQTVIVEAYDVPTMTEYQAGSRPGWRVVYEARMQRNSDTGTPGKEE